MGEQKTGASHAAGWGGAVASGMLLPNCKGFVLAMPPGWVQSKEMERTYVRCEGRLTETPGGAISCSMAGRCEVASEIRSFYATRDQGVLRHVRDAHPDRGPVI
jgi:hypothetical protein